MQHLVGSETSLCRELHHLGTQCQMKMWGPCAESRKEVLLHIHKMPPPSCYSLYLFAFVVPWHFQKSLIYILNFEHFFLFFNSSSFITQCSFQRQINIQRLNLWVESPGLQFILLRFPPKGYHKPTKGEKYKPDSENLECESENLSLGTEPAQGALWDVRTVARGWTLTGGTSLRPSSNGDCTRAH